MQPSAAAEPGPGMNPLGRHSGWDAFPFVAHEVMPRPRLLLAVQGRWSRPVTAVVAGAGFGKTTLLAQAARENQLARSGLDVSLRLDPGDASAASPDVTHPGRARVRSDSVHRARRPRRAAHRRPVGTRADRDLSRARRRARGRLRVQPGSALLHRLVQALPGNAHLLLGSRTLPEIGVARLAVGGEALVLREEDLRFTDAEVADFARLPRGGGGATRGRERVARARGAPRPPRPASRPASTSGSR